MKFTHTVLIVDDNFEDRFILKRYLRKTTLSLVVLEASSGTEGLELLTTSVAELTKSHPEITTPVTLFLDINMPLMNGWQFIEEMERRRGEIQLCPTVVMMYSTSDSSNDKSRALESKTVSNYIVKGESSPEILERAILAVA
ncbi:MAG: response regulator [Granulosicoccus sp.]